MSASLPGARVRKVVKKPLRRAPVASPPEAMRQASARTGSKVGQSGEYSCVALGDAKRIVLMLTPQGRGTFRQQTLEVLATLQTLLATHPQPMRLTVQTVFLRDPRDRGECEQLLAAHHGMESPVTSFVLQPPCNGAALALEVWAIGGQGVQVERFGPQALAISYDGLRWVYCGGVEANGSDNGIYDQTTEALKRLTAALAQAGSGFEHIVRTWFYLGGITEPEAQTQRYKELNRARTDSYREVRFGSTLIEPGIPHGIYPASTGIGAAGMGLLASCLTLQTRREDAFLLPLENPQQTPAYAYHARYSPQSPKFSRAMALVLSNYVTTWISGTASIVNSESRHLDDIERQTEQTIDNIERLIAPENFAFNGIKGAGASLHDLAKVRVYVKRPEDFARCQAVCQRRLGAIPALYTIADVCRPELLVEIEGVAFSPRI